MTGAERSEFPDGRPTAKGGQGRTPWRPAQALAGLLLVLAAGFGVAGPSPSFQAFTDDEAPGPSVDGHYHKACNDPACHPLEDAGRTPTHQPYLEGQCLVCHFDHESKEPNLLRPGGDLLCLDCHTQVELKAPGGPLVHPPDSPPCLSCHAPHQSLEPNLTRGTGPTAQCAQCHEGFLKSAEALPYRHLFFDPRGQCGNCHYAHRRSEQTYLRENVAQSCLTCHDLPIRVDGRQLENVAQRLLDAPHVHGALKLPDSCPSCHTPHGSDQPSLLKAGYPAGDYEVYRTEDYALCWQCHSKDLVESVVGPGATRFSNGQVNLHHLHVAELHRGRACHLCHKAHDSDVSHLLRRHIQYGQWAAPLMYTPLADGGSCQTPCHREREYHRAAP